MNTPNKKAAKIEAVIDADGVGTHIAEANSSVIVEQDAVPNGPALVGETKVVPASVVVIGPPQGRWRIGRKFGSEPVTIPLDDLTKDEMDRLGADPLLVCQVIAAPY